jgi:hypothetical protein
MGKECTSIRIGILSGIRLRCSKDQLVVWLLWSCDVLSERWRREWRVAQRLSIGKAGGSVNRM